MIVIGAKGKLNVEEALNKLKERGIEAQILNACKICGMEHLEVAYEHAKRAFQEERNKSRSIGMELMRYASAKRQIKEAIDFMGAKEEGEYAFVFFNVAEDEARNMVKEMGLSIDNSVLEATMEKLLNFVDEDELRTVDKSFYFDLLFEKIAMVELMK